MGRERALSATPSADVAAVESAISLTGEARLALGAEGAPPLDGIPDIRPVLARSEADGGLLIFEKGKPVARRGRKAMGPSRWSWPIGNRPPQIRAGCQVTEKMSEFPRFTGILARLGACADPVR